MTHTTARRIVALALASLVLSAALRPSAEAEAGTTGRGAGDIKLELASLKAEARMLVVHIDGP